MPLKKLTRDQLTPNDATTQFIASLAIGEGGRGTVAGEGVGKVSIKQRINRAAAAAGVAIGYLRTGPDEVIFEVTGRK